MGKRVTKDDFIRRAKECHDGKYDYSLINYIDTKQKVEIVCPEHGSFWQTPDSHMRGTGCPKCGRKKVGDKKRGSTEQFILQASKIHGGRYDYSKVEYVDARTKVCIICPIHGEFWQTPHAHLSGQGCIKCSYMKCRNGRNLSQEEFILRAKEVHGDKYDYSKVNYVNSTTKVCIICPKHGEFWQTPSGHINAKQGCQKCYDDRRRSLVLGWGINDSLSPIIHGKEKELAYKTWTSMIRRCYSDKYHKHKPSYIGCSVCEEWRYYSNFEKWFDKHFRKGYVLDKDILVQGNRTYSPETCCFVPPYINGLLATNASKRGELKTGVYLHQGKYVAQCGINRKQRRIGEFDTENEAHEAYKKAKYAEIERVATEALKDGIIDKRVYDGLLRFKIKEY